MWLVRDGTPLQQLDPGKPRLQASNLKPHSVSALKGGSKQTCKVSPSTSATPKDPSAGATKKRHRVSFNPAVSFVSAPSPSYSSCSSAAKKRQYKQILVRVAAFPRALLACLNSSWPININNGKQQNFHTYLPS
jgi:hypothetical protein